MFTASIIDYQNHPVLPSFDTNSSAAEYFASCIYLLIQMLNDDKNPSARLEEIMGNSKSRKLIQASSIIVFLDNLHAHSFFKKENILNRKDPNYIIYQKINQLLRKDINDLSIIPTLINLLKEFKIPGIKSIEINETQKRPDESSLNQSNSDGFERKEENKDPLHLQKSALKYQKAGNFNKALDLFEQAIILFVKNGNPYSEEIYHCYSSMLTCYRELKKYDIAIEKAKLGIKIFYGQLPDISRLINELDICLRLEKISISKICSLAKIFYDDKNYSIALVYLLIAEKNSSEKDLSNLAVIYSNIASFYRELGEYNHAVNYCEKALDIRKKQDPDSALSRKTEEKLLHLKGLNKQEHSASTTKMHP